MSARFRRRVFGGFLVGLVCLPAFAAGASRLARRDGPTTTRLLCSAHATQAAAVDEKHMYAISNTTVAQYERMSGRLVRLATTADTRHLNSGFVWEGRVWSAHSNYPATPHASDVRVFDPASGTLTVQHVFPDPPGSLVWCVVKDGRWWCCFAHYGSDNHRTVLVEYEAGGFSRERGRWHFPAEVVADWDGMSASGGLWDGDTLLVSHHHFRVLYRLRLPTEGTTLQFIEALHAPFPGQGIAADPITGGFVGIDRQRRAVVFASACPSAGGGEPRRQERRIVVEDRAGAAAGCDDRPHGL